MSTDATTPSNKTLDSIILNARDAGEMQELLRQYALDQASGAVNAPVAPPQPAAPAPAEGTVLLRRAVQLNGRIQLIEAYSESGLDALQRMLLTGHF